MKNELICGDADEQLQHIETESIDFAITSPPYDDIYDYHGHTYDFIDVARELYRVLKPGRVLVWIEGSKTQNFDESDSPFEHALKFKAIGFQRPDTMIYKRKGFGKPEPITRKRYVQCFDYMFVLSKGKINIFNPIKDRPNKCAGKPHTRRTVRQKDGSLKPNKLDKSYYNNFGLRYNIWEYHNRTNDDLSYHHPASFPEKMVQDHIRTWSNPEETVLDCFMGSGTTAKMALLNNRNFIGIELSKEYIEIAKKRIEPYLKQEKLIFNEK